MNKTKEKKIEFKWNNLWRIIIDSINIINIIKFQL
jgi:hypothetical protein